MHILIQNQQRQQSYKYISKEVKKETLKISIERCCIVSFPHTLAFWLHLLHNRAAIQDKLMLKDVCFVNKPNKILISV